MRALIIDDEPLAHLVILEYAKDLPDLEIVGQCNLATEALEFLKKEEVDLLFLDINMPKIKGLEFLRILKKKPLVIITSAYEEYALESFELEVCDYLLKPFRMDRFLKAIHRAKELYELRNADTTVSSKEETSLFIKSDKRMVQLEMSDIFYLESYGNYVKVWLENEFHLTPSTLSAFEQQLPDQNFYKIHKSYVINLRHIDYLEGNTVVLKNGQVLPIGKNHRQAFKAFIGS
ncbi:MAG: LytTR family DNA-binding domain-containing protein [Bacteroidota bacterium]